MKRLLALCLAVLCWATLAQQLPTGVQTSPNLVGTTMQGTTLTGTTAIESAGGLSGGDTPGHIATTNTIAFGYVTGTAAYRYAFNQALQNSGMSFLGYNYSWEYYNQGENRGTLGARVEFESTVAGALLHSKNWTMPQTTEGWTPMSGTELFTSNILANNTAGIKLSFTGRDDRFWAGYYGPMVRNPSLTLQYTFDTCAASPLSSPECPGYAAAYQTQQCTANPLYSTECPGYAAAYQTQQCAANPLYAVTCPGYEQANYTQQCSVNPLYATTCPGYAAAYKTQQCTLDPLHDTTCPGYEQAYLNAQCIQDSLYSRLCTGYATAYAIKYLVNLDSTTATAVNSSLSDTAAVKANDPTSVNTTGLISTTGNTTVDSVLATPSTTSATSTTSVNSVVAPPPPPVGASPTAGAAAQASAPPPPPPLARQQERAVENRKTDVAVATVERRAGGNKENARATATEQAKELAKKAGEAATLEAQVATQGVVVGLMNYVPGFSAYQNAIVPDVLGAQVARQYHKPTVDNRSAQRQLSGSNETRWRQIVDSQYK